MCRVDDDYDWYVEAEFLEPADKDRHCEDCGRLVAAGEPIIRFLCLEAYYEDERNYVIVVFDPPNRYFDDGDKFHTVIANYDADDVVVDAFEALGFSVDEVRDPRGWTGPPQMNNYCCPQCRAGNHWLEVVCDQHTVCVTVMDLDEHRCDYDDEQLGPDFITLHTLATRRWRTKDFDQLIPVHVVERLARDAADYALAHGLAHA